MHSEARLRLGAVLSGLVLVLARNRIKSSIATIVLALMATAYLVGAVQAY